MSDPADIPGRKPPRRAEPIQPDRPGSGMEQSHQSARPAPEAADPAKRASGERRDAGLKNVREGYGGGTTKDSDDDPSMVPNRPASDAQ